MSSISDNFSRPDGALGNFWSTVIRNTAETMFNSLTGDILISDGAYGPNASGGGDACSLYNGGLSFGNDQWAQATIKTVASPTALLAITAATQVVGTTTYTYTVISGSVAAAISSGRLAVRISGMTNATNNGNFTSTTFVGNTFSVSNPSGITESNSSGVGYCPSDSGAGVMVRGSGTSAATLNGYFFHVGTNSFSPTTTWDHRVSYYELWKVVNGVGTIFAGFTGQNSITLPSPGDVIAVKAVGTTITAYVNGYPLITGSNAEIASGVPGLWTFSISGPQEYIWANWNTVVNPPGNSGTTLTSFSASDTGSPSFPNPVLSTALITDSFSYSNGDLHTQNTNWVYQTGSFTVSSNKAYSSATGIDNAYRSDISPNADQYSQVTAVVTALAATQNCGPAVRMSTSAQTFYAVQYASATLRIIRDVAGTITTILNADANAPVTGDVLAMIIKGNTVYLFKNGINLGAVVDFNSTVLTGNVGLFGAANATANGFSAFSAGNLATPTFPSSLSTLQTVLFSHRHHGNRRVPTNNGIIQSR